MVSRALPVILLSLGLSAAVSAQSPSPSPSAGGREIQVGESRLQLYGFFRTDLVFDDSRPDASQGPLFILSERAGAENVENFTLHPRLSRLGVNVTGPAVAGLGGARPGAKLELDWQNGGRESRAIPRFRHVFTTLSWSATTLLLGSTFDVISPLLPSANADTVMWHAGNIGDRRPQIRLNVQPKAERLQWSAAAAAGLTGAVDQQDLDNDTVRDGEASAFPNLQARLGVSYPVGKRRLAVGISGHLAWMKVSAPVAGETDFDSRSLGADVELPLGSRLMVRGEAWAGRNMSDFRGGIAQAVNRGTGEEISSQGGWAEALFDVTGAWSVFMGYTIEAPDREDLPTGARSRNGAWYVGNRWAVRPVLFGADYLRWMTEYLGAPKGTDNRVNAYVVYSF